MALASRMPNDPVVPSGGRDGCMKWTIGRLAMYDWPMDHRMLGRYERKLLRISLGLHRSNVSTYGARTAMDGAYGSGTVVLG